MLSLLVPIAHPQFVPLQCRVCMIAWIYPNIHIFICNKEGRKGAICFLACQHRGMTDMMTFKILPSISHCGTTSGGILEAGQLSLFWYKLLRNWPKRAICPFIYISNMSNKQMAQSDIKHSNIGEKLPMTTFLFFCPKSPIRAVCYIADFWSLAAWHLKYCPLREMYDYW